MLAALPPDLGEHALQPPEGAHARGRARRCDRLARAGIPIGNQSVLLRGDQRRRRDDAGAVRGPRAHARAALLLLPGAAARGHRALPRADRARASSSSARCAAAPAASRSRSTCSTRRSARCRSPTPTCAAARATTWWSRASTGASGASRTRDELGMIRPWGRRRQRGSRPRLGPWRCCSPASVALSRVLGYAREAVLAARARRGARGRRLPRRVPAARPAEPLARRRRALDRLHPVLHARARAATARRGRGAAARDRARHDRRARARSRRSRSWLAAEPLVALQFPASRRRQQALTVRLTRIVLPGADLLHRGRRAARRADGARAASSSQALAPLVYNLAIIAGGLAARPRARRRGLRVGRARRRRRSARSARAWLERAARARARACGSLCATRAAPLPRGVALPLMLGVDAASRSTSGTTAGSAARLARRHDRGARLRAAADAAAGRGGRPGDRDRGAADARAALRRGPRSGARTHVLRRRCSAGLALALPRRGAATFVLAEPIVRLLYERGALRRRRHAARRAAAADLRARGARPGSRSRSPCAPSTRAATPGGRWCSARRSPSPRRRSTAMLGGATARPGSRRRA